MTQRDDGHDYRDSKNKQEQYEKKKKEKREQAQRLIDKWDVWQYDAYENNKSTWTDEDDEDCQLISKLINNHKSLKLDLNDLITWKDNNKHYMVSDDLSDFESIIDNLKKSTSV